MMALTFAHVMLFTLKRTDSLPSCILAVAERVSAARPAVVAPKNATAEVLACCPLMKNVATRLESAVAVQPARMATTAVPAGTHPKCASALGTAHWLAEKAAALDAAPACASLQSVQLVFHPPGAIQSCGCETWRRRIALARDGEYEIVPENADVSHEFAPIGENPVLTDVAPDRTSAIAAWGRGDIESPHVGHSPPAFWQLSPEGVFGRSCCQTAFEDEYTPKIAGTPVHVKLCDWVKKTPTHDHDVPDTNVVGRLA